MNTLVFGNIRTMDPARPTAEAMVIVDGRIAAIGTREEASAACGGDFTVLEYEGGAILPGLIDTHNHMLWTAMQRRQADLADCRSIAQLLQVVSDFAKTHPAHPWIVSGSGWHVDNLAEGRYPTRQELDQVCAERPVYLPRVGHAAVVNTLALRLAGIDRDTADPSGGRIERDANGDATGLLSEPPASDLVGRLVPTMDPRERVEALRDIQRVYHAAGITGVIDPGLFRDDFAIYEELHKQGGLTVRTIAMPRAVTDLGEDHMLEDLAAWNARTGDGDDMLRLGGVKVFIDGGASLATSLMREPYPDERCNCGIQVTHTPIFHRLVEYCASNGWSMGVHAVGGKAIDIVMSVFAGVNQKVPLKDLRYHIIHAYLWPSTENIAAAARIGIGVATQASMQYRFAPLLVKRMGAEAVGRATPIRDWMDAGVVVGGGSDSPVTPYQPLLGIWHAITRWVDALALVLGRDQSISAQQALEMYTRNGAWLCFAEYDRGMLRTGMHADWVSLSVDPLNCAPDEIRDAKVRATVVGGHLVYAGE
ncbi:MAG: amidohydrolase [Cupriavidus necator]